MKQVVKNPDSLRRFFSRIEAKANWEKPLLISVSTYRPPRSLEQNSLLHLLFRQVADHVGRPEAEIKDIFKHQFGPHKRVRLNDIERIVPKGTSEYNKQELSDMIEIVYQKGAEWSVEFEEVA